MAIIREERAEKSPQVILMESDPMLWGQIYFPHHFKKQSPEFHYALIHSARKYKNLGVAAPRHSAKSTYLSFLYPFHKITFRKEPFIVLISNTFKKAAEYLNTIKMELTDNRAFKDSMQTNPITFKRDAEGDTIFEHTDGFKTRFLCKGVDQIGSLRGEKFGANRPGLIIFDDMEDDELVRSVERRAQLKNEFDEVISRLGHDDTQTIVVGTILHDDSQLAKIVSSEQYPKFHKIIYRAHINPDQNDESSLWPEEWSVEELKKLRSDEPNVYSKEMQNDPVAGLSARFHRRDFRYWKEEAGYVTLIGETPADNVSYPLTDLKPAISCDLAWKEKKEADSTAIIPGYITPNSDILIAPYIHRKAIRPDELANLLFGLVEMLEEKTGSTVPIGFEKAMLENVTQWLLKREMRKRNKFLMTKELIWDADKNTRIETRLEPRYSQHVIYHQQGMGDLEHQLERFPSGTHDDLIDALQGLVQLLQFPKTKKKPTQADDEFMRVRKILIDSKLPKQHYRKINGRSQFPKWNVYTSFR